MTKRELEKNSKGLYRDEETISSSYRAYCRGKTKASIGLAKAIGGEIISADSMQVYRHMDIGSAKDTGWKRCKACPHHLIDVLEPSEEFHVVRFQQMAKAAMEEIYSRGHIPMIVGGTGFYIQAVLYDIDFTENDGDDAYRQELADYADANGPLSLPRALASRSESSGCD